MGPISGGIVGSGVVEPVSFLNSALLNAAAFLVKALAPFTPTLAPTPIPTPIPIPIH